MLKVVMTPWENEQSNYLYFYKQFLIKDYYYYLFKFFILKFMIFGF